MPTDLADPKTTFSSARDFPLLISSKTMRERGKLFNQAVFDLKKKVRLVRIHQRLDHPQPIKDMKLTRIFGIVLGLHVVVIALVMLQPGCQSAKKSTLPDLNASATVEPDP